jgi:DNA-binding transcriptional MocR family regulator
MICTGSQQAIDLIARAYLNPGDTVAMEAPSYLGALQVFGLAQANIQAIEQTKIGPDLTQLEEAFASGSIKLFYGVPDFHNPTGVCWSLEVRKAVADLCNRYNVGFIEDVPYRDLRFTGTALPLVSSFCQDNAFVMRSFSKTSSPGLRLGMVSAPKKWLAALVQVKQASDLHTGLPLQAVLLSLLKSDAFPSHLEMVRVNYQQRYQVLLQALEPLLGEHCECNPVDGGMFVWLKLLNAQAMDVTQALMQKNVAVVPGDVFYSNADIIQPALRLNFTHSTLAQLETAVERLADVFRAQAK